MSVCRVCAVTIRFVRMRETGRLVPVEPIPDPQGTVAARLVKPARYGFTPSLVGHVVSKDHPLEPGQSLFMAHYGECERNAIPTSPTPAPPSSLFDA